MFDRKINVLGKEIAKNTRNNVEDKFGESVITKDNGLGYKYIN